MVAESTHFVIDTVVPLVSTPLLLDNCITSLYHFVSNPSSYRHQADLERFLLHHHIHLLLIPAQPPRAGLSTCLNIEAIHNGRQYQFGFPAICQSSLPRHIRRRIAAMRLCRRFANGESSPVVGRWEKASESGLELVRGGRKRRRRRWRACELTCAFVCGGI